MPVLKNSIITSKVEPDLKNDFMIIAENRPRPTSQISRDLIRVYVENNRILNELTAETIAKAVSPRALALMLSSIIFISSGSASTSSKFRPSKLIKS